MIGTIKSKLSHGILTWHARWFVTQSHLGSHPWKIFGKKQTKKIWSWFGEPSVLLQPIRSMVAEPVGKSTLEERKNMFSIKRSNQCISLLFFQWNIPSTDAITAVKLTSWRAAIVVFKQTFASLAHPKHAPNCRYACNNSGDSTWQDGFQNHIIIGVHEASCLAR